MRGNGTAHDNRLLLLSRLENIRQDLRHIDKYKAVAIDIFGFVDMQHFNHWHTKIWPECDLSDCCEPNIFYKLRQKAEKMNSGPARDRIALLLYLNGKGTGIGLANIFGFKNYTEFATWHDNTWPESSLEGCRGDHVLTLLKMKAAQMGRGK